MAEAESSLLMEGSSVRRLPGAHGALVLRSSATRARRAGTLLRGTGWSGIAAGLRSGFRPDPGGLRMIA